MSSTSEQYAHLQALYIDENWQRILHPLHYIDGLIFAVSAAPEIPMPDVWLPWCIKGTGTISDKDVDQLTVALMALLQSRLNAMREERFDLPTECEFVTSTGNTALESGASSELQAWLTGLLFGHQKLEPVWLAAWTHMQAKLNSDTKDDNHNNESEGLLFSARKDLSHCLRMFSTFANPELAIQQAEQNGNPQLAEKLPIIFKSFHLALKQYVDISGKLVSYLPNQFEMYSE